jgi:hypothetical protein
MRINTFKLEEQPFLRGISTWQLEQLSENSMLAEFQPVEKIVSEGGSATVFI